MTKIIWFLVTKNDKTRIAISSFYDYINLCEMTARIDITFAVGS